jgi:hypothetical protein
MIGRVTVEIEGPFGSTLPAIEPFFGCFSQRGEHILLNLPVPG